MEFKGLRSPLKEKALRLPGQSLQERLINIAFGRLLPSLWVASTLALLALLEWVATVGHWRRMPGLYAAAAGMAAAVCAFQFWRSQGPIRRLQLGRDGERTVGELLEPLRERGAHVFHDVPGDHFNLDHVLVCRRGIFVIETKTRSKPAAGDARVTMTEDAVVVGGFRPNRDPVVQVQAGARWLAELLERSTGQRWPVRAVVLFPGWFVEPMTGRWKEAGMPWVLEPKGLRNFIGHEPVRLEERDVRLAAAQLSAYVRAQQGKRAQ